MSHDTMILSILCPAAYGLEQDEWNDIKDKIEKALKATGIRMRIGIIGYHNNSAPSAFGHFKDIE